jgi:phospholipase C
VPPGLNPDGTLQGIRVPMVIVSPYAKRGFTDTRSATFTSMLRFTEEAFGLKTLGVNDAKAYDYSKAFNFTTPGSQPRVWPQPRPIPEATKLRLAALPQDDNDAT